MIDTREVMDMGLKEYMARVEKEVIVKMLPMHFTITDTADTLGIMRTTLVQKMKKHGIRTMKTSHRLAVEV